MPTFATATLSLSGPAGKVRVEISGERTTCGRTRDNEVVLNDPAVSSHHCEFVADRRTGLVVRDLNSSNGTYVNGRRVKEAPVYDGDALKIGQFQGRIQVRDLEGRPIRPPGIAGVAIAIGAVVAALLVVGGAFVYVAKVRRDQDRVAFAEYENRAKELLATEPCTPIETALIELRKIESRLDAPVLGNRGRLTAAQRRKDQTILAASRKREPHAEAALKAVGQAAERQKTALLELKAHASKFHDAGATDVAARLETLFAVRSEAAAEIASNWKKYVAQLGDYHDHLERLTNRGDSAAAEALAGWRFRVEPGRLLDECQATFGRTQQEGLLKLAEVAF